ncbi:MAG: leucine-rich repeat domain-containing protein, partial [Clostridia bacterium]|nr:leucine-rich repeat domain-containing protein [Clostridia bacterium]
TSSSDIFYQAGQNGTGITLTIGNNVTTIPAYLFYGPGAADAPKLTSVNFGSGLKSIGNYAFRYCTGLTSLEFPSTLTSIGSYAFQYCTGLTKVYIPSSVTTITAGSYSAAPFYGCSTSLKIYCEAASKPSGWGSYWNYGTSSATFTTTWSYSREDFEAL